jgi:UDP-N-acetylglucosamine acyltransferase
VSAPLVHPAAIVSPGAELGPGVSVGAYAIVGPHVRAGEGTRIHAHAIVDGHTHLGAGNEVFPHTVLGGVPQDLKYRGEPTRLVVGDGNVFREGVTVNLGTAQGGYETVIGSRNLLMANAHVAHDCVVGDRVILANNVMLAGLVRVQDGAIVNGGAGIHHFTTVGRLAYVGGLSRITRDIPPYSIVEGHPSRVRGVNVIGLRRAGLGEPTILAIKEAWKRLFRGDSPMRESLRDVERDFAEVPEVLELVAFLRKSEEGRLGRQGEDPGRGLVS